MAEVDGLFRQVITLACKSKFSITVRTPLTDEVYIFESLEVRSKNELNRVMDLIVQFNRHYVPIVEYKYPILREFLKSIAATYYVSGQNLSTIGGEVIKPCLLFQSNTDKQMFVHNFPWLTR